jgi:formylglycine-generating enzyme required for sulfatase activity
MLRLRARRWILAGLTTVFLVAPGFVRPADAPPRDAVAATRLELREEIVADRRDGPRTSCEAVQTASAVPPVAFAFWATLSEADATGGCGSGAFPQSRPANSRTPPGAPPAPAVATASEPFLIEEVTADVGWDAGAMDPGPLGAFQVFVTLRTRQATGMSQEGRRQYGPVATEHRTFRLEPGEEFVLPLALQAGGREALGVHDVLVRFRAAWAPRDGAIRYGAVAVTHAAPGSEVLLDGGVAGLARRDGSLLMSQVPAGLREVRLREPSGKTSTRMLLVVPGRRIPVRPEAASVVPEPGLSATGKNAQGFEEYRRGRDGATMVEIPEGEFPMGNLKIEGAPQPHTVFVSRFLMDKLPLTVGRYAQFASETGRPLPPDPWWGVHDSNPVAFLRWDEAKAYCEWAGGRLPTEAEREKAARGTDGRDFPWGSEPPSEARAVFGHFWGEQGNDTAGARPAGASPYGLLDMGGNRWEFCEDWWSPGYDVSSPGKDPRGPKTGRARLVRGSSWDSRWVTLYASERNFAYVGYREGDFGFRCAANPPQAAEESRATASNR